MLPAIASDYESQIRSVDELRQYGDEKPLIIFSHVPLEQKAIDEEKRLKFEEGIIEHAQTGFYQSQEKLKAGLEQRQEKYLYLLEQLGSMESLQAWLEEHDNQADEVFSCPVQRPIWRNLAGV